MGNTKGHKTKVMPARWDNVARRIVMDSMDFQSAMRAENYCDGYLKTNGHLIKQDTRFSKCIEKYRAKLEAKSHWDRQKLESEYIDLYQDSRENDDRGNAKGCLADLARMQGLFIDKRINLDLDLPPADPEARDQWLQDYYGLCQEVIDVTHAVCME